MEDLVCDSQVSPKKTDQSEYQYHGNLETNNNLYNNINVIQELDPIDDPYGYPTAVDNSPRSASSPSKNSFNHINIQDDSGTINQSGLNSVSFNEEDTKLKKENAKPVFKAILLIFGMLVTLLISFAPHHHHGHSHSNEVDEFDGLIGGPLSANLNSASALLRQWSPARTHEFDLEVDKFKACKQDSYKQVMEELIHLNPYMAGYRESTEHDHHGHDHHGHSHGSTSGRHDINDALEAFELSNATKQHMDSCVSESLLVEGEFIIVTQFVIQILYIHVSGHIACKKTPSSLSDYVCLDQPKECNIKDFLNIEDEKVENCIEAQMQKMKETCTASIKAWGEDSADASYVYDD